jgi:hypothetical protein
MPVDARTTGDVVGAAKHEATKPSNAIEDRMMAFAESIDDIEACSCSPSCSPA